MSAVAIATDELRERAARRRREKHELLEKAGAVGEGDRREKDLAIGDRVRCADTLYRHTCSPGGTDETLRVWRRQSTEGPFTGWIVGARTLQSGAYRARSGVPTPRSDPTPAHLAVWRTHRVYLVARGLWEKIEKVYVDDLEKLAP